MRMDTEVPFSDEQTRRLANPGFIYARHGRGCKSPCIRHARCESTLVAAAPTIIGLGCRLNGPWTWVAGIQIMSKTVEMDGIVESTWSCAESMYWGAVGVVLPPIFLKDKYTYISFFPMSTTHQGVWPIRDLTNSS